MYESRPGERRPRVRGQHRTRDPCTRTTKVLGEGVRVYSGRRVGSRIEFTVKESLEDTVGDRTTGVKRGGSVGIKKEESREVHT